MAIPNTFTNGTVADAGEINENFEESWGYPKVLHYGTTATGQAFTPTKSDSRIVVWVSGQWDAAQSVGASSTNIDLDIDSVTKDTKSIYEYHHTANVSIKIPFSLLWSDTDLSTSETDIDITTSSGSISNVKIIVMEYIK